MGSDPAPPAAAAADRRRLVLALTTAALLAAWLLAAWPVLSGVRTFFFRDLFAHFLPLKAFGAAELARGRIPALNPTWALGQPFRGDPNAVAFYPDNLLYLALPVWTAFNLHILLHWLLAAIAMGVLAREVGRSREAALLAALAYGGGGFALAGLTFYTYCTVIAWWPLVLAAAHRGTARAVAAGALACGMALLGGDPVLAAIGVVPLAMVAVREHGGWRGLRVAAGVGAGGLLVALPQLVATLRVLGHSFRGGHGVPAGEALLYRLQPFRLLELLTPDAWGMGHWPLAWLPRVPLLFAFYPGIVATLLTIAGARRERAWAVLAGLGCLLATAPFVSGGLLVRLSGGLFRYPEKAIFWLALGVPLLAAAGLDRALADRRAALRAGIVLGVALAIAAVAVPLAARGEPEWADASPVPASLLLVALLGALALWALWRRLPVMVVLLELAALVPLQPMLLTEPRAPFEHPSPWMAALPSHPSLFTLWDPDEPGDLSARVRQQAVELAVTPGVLHGASYPLAGNLDGLGYWMSTYLLDHVVRAGSPAGWLRTLGVQALSSPVPRDEPGLRTVAATTWGTHHAYLVLVEHAAPFAWWPRTLEVAARPAQAFAAVAAHGEDPTSRAVVPVALPHTPGARLRVLTAEPDRVVVECDGGGGLLVVRRAFQPLWRARAGSRALPVVPADLALTGVVVPAGLQRVELRVSSGPEMAAGVVAVVAAALLALLAVPRRFRRRDLAGPPTRA